MKQDKVIFFKEPHTYWYKSKKLKPVTTLTKQFIPEYDSDYWLIYKTLQAIFTDEFMSHYSKLGGYMPQKSILFGKFMEKVDINQFLSKRDEFSNQWELKRTLANFNGTRFHEEREKEAYQRGYLVNPWDRLQYSVNFYEKEFDNESVTMDLSQLADGAYVELLVHNVEMGVAGQIDECYIQTINGIRYIDINDHKTNEKIPTKSSPDYCLPPFDEFQASKHFGYVMQLNMYAYLLEKAGFVVRNMAYTHYKNYDINLATRVDVPNILIKIKLAVESELYRID